MPPILPPTNQSKDPLSPSPRVEKTRQRILQAARQVFSRSGYAGATTRGIAEAAGVSELTLFRHFGAKKTLFLAAIAQESPLGSLQAALSAPLSGEAQTDLQRIGTAFLQATLARRSEILMALHEAQTQPELRDISLEVPRLMQGMLAGYLERLAAAGSLRAVDCAQAAQVFLGALFAYAIRLPLEENQPAPDVERIVAQVVDVFLHGIVHKESAS